MFKSSKVLLNDYILDPHKFDLYHVPKTHPFGKSFAVEAMKGSLPQHLAMLRDQSAIYSVQKLASFLWSETAPA